MTMQICRRRSVLSKSKKEIFRNPLTNFPTCDTICIQGKENQAKVKKKRFKKSKKVLDKPHKVWYNKDTKRTGTSGK
jgi:hypothetical protein